MAQVDISRFGSNIQKLFAPSIQEGQVFIAYLDAESNSYTVKGDNISSGGSSASNDSVERLEQNFSSLQTNVSSLQTSVNGLQTAITEIQHTPSSESNSVIVVNDIIYGFDNGSLNPTDVNQLKGRPLLVNDGGNLYFGIECYLEISFEPRVLMSSNTIFLSTSINDNDVYAGFGDGKIHTISNYNNVTSVALNNGDFIFNKADNSLYIYDATNHKFVKASGKRHYVVDYLVDYVGKSLPSNLNSGEVVFFQIGNEYFSDSVLINCGGNVNITGEIRFANIQSILNDDASIYTLFGSEGSYSYNIEGIRVTHDLYDGDTIYNKADGCTYTFTVNGSTKSFVKTSPTTQSADNGGSSLAIVDDFVYGHQNSETGSPSLSFDNLKNLKGRTFIQQYYDGIYLTSKDTYEEYNLTHVFYNTSKIPDGKCFAGFGDGKIHTIHYDSNNDDYSVTSVAMSNRDFILNKADNALFTYDVTNHKFIKVGSNNHFVVDMIIDYVGETPSSYDWMNSSAITDGTIHHGPLRIYDYYVPSNFCFANIQSTLSDDAEIYNGAMVTIHDLYDGDTVYNKADGCTYTFKNDGTTKSFVRTITPAIPPVLDIIYINNWFDAEENDSASEGDKYIYCYSKYEDLKPAIFKTYENGKWTERNIQAGECYASTNTHRIYTFQSSVFQSACFDIPIGASFFNKADNSLYVYDGTDYIKIGSNS